TMGDGYMVAFKSAADGLRCAIAMQQAMAGMEEGVRIRIGLHTGEMLKEGDDFFGRHVNLASRVAGQAGGGEIFVSGLVRELVSGQDFAFDDLGERPMKGFEQPVRVWAARWEA
ncbi:MAG: adenylate/guanylate cyclase domain-containing protein, partial [Anaerolineaceae bacterium]